MVRFCDTELRFRADAQKDLWCKTHQMWVYAAVNSELLNDEHEVKR